VIRAVLAAQIVVALGCFSKPRFDGAVADAAIDDAADGGDAPIEPVDAPQLLPNIAFVTSMPLAVGSVQSTTAADTICDTRAATAGLPANTYIAWVSASGSGGQSAASRIPFTTRGWVRPDGVPFANTRVELLDGDILAPLRIDENNVDVGSVLVGTATLATGSTDGADCVGLSGSGESITFGYSDATRRVWTDANASISCFASVHMYCLGIDQSVPVAPAVTPGARLAFLSGLWTPTGGLAGADTHCQNIATNRSLPGTFVALLATQTASASSRLTNGTPWARIDGLALAATAIDVINGTLAVPLNVDASGDYVVDEPVWTGVPSGGTLSDIGIETCNDWVDTAGFGTSGSPVRTSSAWFYDEMGVSCTQARRLYCFQQ